MFDFSCNQMYFIFATQLYDTSRYLSNEVALSTFQLA